MFVNARDCKVTVPALLFDPAFFVFDFAAGNERTKFLLTDEEMLGQSPFIDVRFEPLSRGQFWVETKELFALEALHDVPRPRPVFIFHHAFVCSTLLARCLNQSDAFFSLKEPWILRRMADHKRAQGRSLTGAQWREMFCKYVQLLCRNFRTGSVPVIKATNVANNLLIDVLRFLPDCPILYLHSDLESFLISNLKKTGDTQQKMSGLANAFLRDSDFAQKYPGASDTTRLSFLQVCALIWLVNLYRFKCDLDQYDSARVRTLAAGELLAALPGSLDSLSRFFGHVPDAGELRQMTDTRVVGTNAKDQSTPYGPLQRQAEMKAIASRYEQELAAAVAWVDPLARELGVLEFLRRHRLLA